MITAAAHGFMAIDQGQKGALRKLICGLAEANLGEMAGLRSGSEFDMMEIGMLCQERLLHLSAPKSIAPFLHVLMSPTSQREHFLLHH